MATIDALTAFRYLVDAARRFEEVERTQRETRAVFTRSKEQVAALIAALRTATIEDELAVSRWESEGGAYR